MDELIVKVAERAGISPDQARKAIDTVVEQLEGRLPEPIASQLKGLLDGNSGGGGKVDPADLLKGASDKLGGLFGR